MTIRLLSWLTIAALTACQRKGFSDAEQAQVLLRCRAQKDFGSGPVLDKMCKCMLDELQRKVSRAEAESIVRGFPNQDAEHKLIDARYRCVDSIVK